MDTGEGGGEDNSAVREDTKIAQQAAERALELSEKRRAKREQNDMDDEIVNPKAVKTVKSVVELFQTVKELSQTPAQKAVDEAFSGMIATSLKNAFGAPQPKSGGDLIDKVLNSQLAYGIGQGLGSRSPELVESLGRTFGAVKAEQMIDGIIGRGGRAGAGGAGGIPGTPPPGNPEQSNLELLLSLDPNNPEHVSGYAASQGNISVDVARKMLMIHQDDLIKQMENKGADMNMYRLKRNEMLMKNRSSDVSPGVPPQDVYVPPVTERPTIPDYEQVPETVQEYRRSENRMPEVATIEDIRNIQSPDKEWKDGNIETSVTDSNSANSNSVSSNSASSNTGTQAEGMDSKLDQFVKSISDIVGHAIEKIDQQDVTISQLRGDLDAFRNKEIIRQNNIQGFEVKEGSSGEGIQEGKGGINSDSSSTGNESSVEDVEVGTDAANRRGFEEIESREQGIEGSIKQEVGSEDTIRIQDGLSNKTMLQSASGEQRGAAVRSIKHIRKVEKI